MVRTLITPISQTIFFEVPIDYIGKELEVIAFTKNEYLENSQLPQKQVTFNAISIDTKGYKFNRDEANER
jgi:hypothetical protein